MRIEKGQSTAFYAIIMSVMAVFILGLLAYLITNSRMMDVIAVADLAAHAGAQEIIVQPDGSLEGLSQGSNVAQAYFEMQAPTYAHLVSVACGVFDERPGCQVQAQVQTPSYLFFPSRMATVNAIGYLAYGVTEGDQ